MPRPAQLTTDRLRVLLQAGGPRTALELAQAAGVDRSTVARTLPDLGAQLVRLGGAQRARYALRRPVRAAGDRWPIYRVDENGRAQTWAELEALHGGWRLTWGGSAPAWAEHIVDRENVAEGFPFFLGDARPQGFLGRALARRVSASLGLSGDVRLWDDDENLVCLQAEGDDLPGNLVVGDGPMRRALERQLATPVVVARGERTERYVEFAAQASAGQVIGSSAGGENPKFLCAAESPAGGAQAVLVKFSAPLDTPAGRRWADLLAAERIAHEVLAARGLATAEVDLFDAGGRRFFEVERHDRTGARGRRGVVSLEALHGSMPGRDAADWTTAVSAMAAHGLVDAAGVEQVRRLACFGQLIGNVDMHFGNLSFWLDDALPFRLAPAYDMLPMAWAPSAQGEIVERPFAPPPPLPALLPAWSEAAGWAEEFWARVAKAAVTPEFAQRASAAGETVQRLRAHFIG